MARLITSTAIYCFGPFRLDAPAGVLTRDSVPVALSARAFAVLELLVRREGGIVTRNEILAEVWRGVTVEENNLTVQISALRRALGEMPGQGPVIITVPNQGYRIAGTVTQVPPQTDDATPPTQSPAAAPVNPPPRSTPPRRVRATLAAGGIVAVLAVTCVAAILTRIAPTAQQEAIRSAPLLSLVILPFRNLATDHQDDPLADAVSDDE